MASPNDAKRSRLTQAKPGRGLWLLKWLLLLVVLLLVVVALLGPAIGEA